MTSDDFWLFWIGCCLALAAICGIGAAWGVPGMRPYVIGGLALVVVGGIAGLLAWRAWKRNAVQRYWNQRMLEDRRRYERACQDLIDLYDDTIGGLP